MATNNEKFRVEYGLETQNIEFVSPDESNTIQMQLTDSDTLAITGNTGQLFAVTDSQSGTLFSVGDISGIPSIEVDDDGTIRLAEFNGTVLIGTNTVSGSALLQVDGDITSNGNTVITTAELGNATITLTAGTDLSTGGNFTTNQSANETITIDHSSITRTNTTSSVSPAYGENFDVVDSVTTSETGHITAVNTKTVTLPAAYSHPIHPGDDINIDTGVLSGATVISDLDFNVTTDINGHVTDANATIATRNLTASDVGAIAKTDGFGGDVSGTYDAIVIANDSHSHSNYITSNADDTASGSYTFTNTQPFIFSESVDNLLYTPQEGTQYSNIRHWLSFDYTNDASYPMLTNRTPNGDFVIASGTTAGGGEIERIRINGGDGTQDISITNANIQLNSNQLHVDTSDRGISNVTGDFGSVQTVGAGVGNYSGYSISGRLVFMENGIGVGGIYDDVNGQWKIRTDPDGGGVELYHNNIAVVETLSNGLWIHANGTSTTDLIVDSGGHANVKIDRGSTSYDNNLLFYTGSSLTWRISQQGLDNNIVIRNEVAATDVVSITDTTTRFNGTTEIYDDTGLKVYATTNGAGATIEFSDSYGSAYAQKGTITYNHYDGVTGTEPVTSSDGWIFSSTESNTTVNIQGYLNVTSDANIDNTLYVDVATYSPIYYDATGTTYYLDISNTGTSMNVPGKIIASTAEFTGLDNTDPGSDDLHVSGYGISGNRAAAPVYVHNFGAGGVVLSTNGTLGNGIVLKATTSLIENNADTNIKGRVNIGFDTSTTFDSYVVNDVVSTSRRIIATVPIAFNVSGKFLVQVEDETSGEKHISEIMWVTDGTTVFGTEYAVLYTGSAALATFDVDISGSDVRLLATQASTNNMHYVTTIISANTQI